MPAACEVGAGAGGRRRLREFVACHRCAVGWVLYVAVAAAIVALYAAG